MLTDDSWLQIDMAGLPVPSGVSRGVPRLMVRYRYMDHHLEVGQAELGLAAARGRAGAEMSEPLEQRVLEARRRVLGPEHPDTLVSTANLAATLHQLGRAAEADPLQRQVLEASRRVLGPEHPDTLISTANLAATLRQLGRAAEAEPLEQQVLEARDRRAKADLAALLHQLRRATEAEPLQRQVLEARRWVSGPEHPATLTAMADLAVTLYQLGRAAEAEALQRQVVEASRRVLGSDGAGRPDAA